MEEPGLSRNISTKHSFHLINTYGCALLMFFISKKYAVTSWRVCHHSVTKILFKYNLAELTTVTGIFEKHSNII
jgi:hypothetical protein